MAGRAAAVQGGGAASGDGYVRAEATRWTLGTASVEKVVSLEGGRLLLRSFRNRQSGREMMVNRQSSVELSPEMIGSEIRGPWTLEGFATTTHRQGELQLDLKLACGALSVTKSYVVYPASAVIREWYTCRNTGSAPLLLVEPRFLAVAAQLGPAADKLDFHWMVGAHNEAGSWVLKTEKLPPGKPRKFDSYDPFPPRGQPSPNDSKMGSESYAPWYAFYDRDTKDGLLIGWDYMGHWASQFTCADDGTVAASLRVAGHKQMLAPGQAMTTPMAFTAIFREDLDNAGNELLDWQYRYLWDYTRAGWFPSIPMLGYWYKGTGWGEPNVPWWGSGKADIPSQFTKIFRMADLIRQVGADNYHRDWGWWDRAGDWNGPDFGTSGKYLRKSDIGQIIYAFLYTVDPQSKLAQSHPDWLIGQTLDMSQPEVVAHIQRQLDEFHRRWGDFAWRNDSTPTAPRNGDDTPLLAQEQNFREIVRSFLDKYPRSSFQSVNGGGNEAGYDYVRLSGMFQFSDGGAIMPLRNYYASLLLPPDKLMDNGDQWNPDQYDKAKWRALLSMAIMTTGDTWDKGKLEGLRELFDIYHYLAAQGVVGRWVKIYRPAIEGDDPTMYIQRLSRDRLRGLIVPARSAPGKVTLRPKGLLPGAEYNVSFQESASEQELSGAALMRRGIAIEHVQPGELIYLNLPYHPGNRRDRAAPTAPREVAKQSAENMGFPGIELTWTPGTDDQWLSYYEILRNGRAIDKVAKGTYYFDHSVGADLAARYEVRSVDGAGNVSPPAQARGPEAEPAEVFDDADAGLKYSGAWRHEQNVQPAYRETISSSDQRDAAVEVNVEGRRFRWFSKLGGDCGKARVSIDGSPAETVDTYCSDDVWGACVFTEEWPAAGKHVVRITVLGEKNPRAKDHRVYMDGVRTERK
jgi:hypothetical protein